MAGLELPLDRLPNGKADAGLQGAIDHRPQGLLNGPPGNPVSGLVRHQGPAPVAPRVFHPQENEFKQLFSWTKVNFRGAWGKWPRGYLRLDQSRTRTDRTVVGRIVAAVVKGSGRRISEPCRVWPEPDFHAGRWRAVTLSATHRPTRCWRLARSVGVVVLRPGRPLPCILPWGAENPTGMDSQAAIKSTGPAKL